MSSSYYCQTVASLLIWGALSDKRTGLRFTIAAEFLQCIRSACPISPRYETSDRTILKEFLFYCIEFFFSYSFVKKRAVYLAFT
jgi:hypothetical protein